MLRHNLAMFLSAMVNAFEISSVIFAGLWFSDNTKNKNTKIQIHFKLADCIETNLAVCKPPKQTKSLGKTFSIRVSLFIYLLLVVVWNAHFVKGRQMASMEYEKAFTINGILSMDTIQHFIYLNVRNCGKFMRKTLANIQKKTYIHTYIRHRE